MLLRHATLVKNMPGILRAGLLCNKSRGKEPVVSACAPGKNAVGLPARHPPPRGQGPRSRRPGNRRTKGLAEETRMRLPPLFRLYRIGRTCP